MTVIVGEKPKNTHTHTHLLNRNIKLQYIHHALTTYLNLLVETIHFYMLFYMLSHRLTGGEVINCSTFVWVMKVSLGRCWDRAIPGFLRVLLSPFCAET